MVKKDGSGVADLPEPAARTDSGCQSFRLVSLQI